MAETKNISISQPGNEVPQEPVASSAIGELVLQARNNYLEKDIEVAEGLLFNTYETLRQGLFYLMSRFIDTDENPDGSMKFFHNIINPRCAQMTKNLDLDTKDMLIVSTGERGYAGAIIVRAMMKKWMRETNFGEKLNRMAENLPKQGVSIWKRVKRSENEKYYPGGLDVIETYVELMFFDPTVRRLSESSIVAEKMLLDVQDVMEKADAGTWDAEACERIINAQRGSPSKSRFLRDITTADISSFNLTDVIPKIELYDVYGWFPETSIPEDFYKDLGIKEPDCDKMRYLNVVLSLTSSGEGVSACEYALLEEIEPEDFPYEDILLPRRVPNRYLPESIPEALTNLQIRANELCNRLARALRSGTIHLFQSRGSGPVNNLLQDAEDGDVIITRHPIEPVAMELRAYNQAQTEYNNIERQADLIANTPEVVTGESLPTNTPYRLGAQLSESAAKVTLFIRQSIGLSLARMFNDWIIPDLIDNIGIDDIVEIAGSAEELKFFEESFRRARVYETVARYIEKNGKLPPKEELDLVEKAISEQMTSAKDRLVKIDEKFIKEELRGLQEYQFVFDAVGETFSRKLETETLGNLLQILASNPMVTQDPTARGILLKIAEYHGMSLPYLSALNAPVDPKAQAAGAAAPAAQAFQANPGDAAPGSPGGATAPVAA